MRIELSGPIPGLVEDFVVVTFTANDDFDAASYRTQGYHFFDVVCIGGGGGRGGGVDTDYTGSNLLTYGGTGGGGGFHRVQGMLAGLPSSCPVVVGAAGTNGTDVASGTPPATTDGEDGGYSSFNGTTCRASGGKGGKRVQTNWYVYPDAGQTYADGGEGGVGGSIVAGGGADGGLAGVPHDPGPGTPGTNGGDGQLLDWIGGGGGGGAGGVAHYVSANTLYDLNEATSGGAGSSGPRGFGISVPGEVAYSPYPDPPAGAIIGGLAGGAKATLLNYANTSYGVSGFPGIVVVRVSIDLL